MKLSRLLLVSSVFLLLASSAQSQQPQVPPAAPPQRAIINFIVPIDSNTINQLLQIVNNQVRAGVKNITIVISSPGGDTASAFAAYNILRNVDADITTFNSGNIDSAAMLLYCAGKHRYSFPNPARFLIHSNALTLGAGVPLDYNFLEAEMAQIRSLNSEIVQIIAANSNKKPAEIEQMMKGQTILTPEEARDWGLVNEIRSTFMEPGASFVTVNTTPQPEKNPIQHGDPASSIILDRPVQQGTLLFHFQ
jgi:ATP-dependent Clp protease, protease subunit